MLSEEQAVRFSREGFATLRGLFSPAELAPVQAYLAEHADTRWADKNDDPLREPHYHSRPLFELCTDPRLLDSVERLIGPDVVLLYCHILNKKPGGLRVAWHQDGPYWWRVEPKVAVTAWVALDEATPENGCMRVIPGSHAGHRDLGQRPTDTPDLIQDRPFELPGEAVNHPRAVELLMGPGDVSFHDSYLVHGSEPNLSGNRRAAVTIRYIPAAARIQDTPDRRQFLVRGRAHDNGNVYYRFGDLPARHWTHQL